MSGKTTEQDARQIYVRVAMFREALVQRWRNDPDFAERLREYGRRALAAEALRSTLLAELGVELEPPTYEHGAFVRTLFDVAIKAAHEAP